MTQEDYKGIAKELFKLMKPMLKREFVEKSNSKDDLTLDPNDELLDLNGLAKYLKISRRKATEISCQYPSVIVGKRLKFPKSLVNAKLLAQ